MYQMKRSRNLFTWYDDVWSVDTFRIECIYSVFDERIIGFAQVLDL